LHSTTTHPHTTNPSPPSSQVLINANAGHLVRTKTSSSNEGGVAAGYAVLDSPLLASPGEGLLPRELEGGGGGGGEGGVLGAVARLMQ